MGELSAIVLAAGYSSRMGDLKPLADLGGRTLLAWTVGTFKSIGVGDVVVVTGHRGGEVATAAEALGARAVPNPRFDDGMYTSVQAGAAAVPEGRRFFLLPVDCPLVRPETAGRLARAGAAAGAEVTLPEFSGAAGHPPLLAPALREAILTTEPAGGLRELLAGRPEPPLRVAVDDPGVLHDADLPGDLERLLPPARSRGCPPSAAATRCSGTTASLRSASPTRGRSPPLRRRSRRRSTSAASASAFRWWSPRLCSTTSPARSRGTATLPLRCSRTSATRESRLWCGITCGWARRPATRSTRSRPCTSPTNWYRTTGSSALDARFAVRLARHAADPDALAGVRARLEEARLVQARVEAILGRPL